MSQKYATDYEDELFICIQNQIQIDLTLKYNGNLGKYKSLAILNKVRSEAFKKIKMIMMMLWKILRS